ALQAFLLGGTGPFAFLGGAGGKGILGRVLPGVFGGGASAGPIMGGAPAMDRSMALTGQFTVSGQDLQLVLDRANQFTNR
ncbi:MAG: hypothetical protein ACO39F_04110, partial [Candidatus Nanopelagicaceae bacterium]